jgi:hypothetical protein
MIALGRYLSGLAEGSPADFDRALRSRVMSHVSAHILHLDYKLRNTPEAPDFWKRDVEDYLNHMREALTHRDFDIPYDLKSRGDDEATRRLLQRVIGRYGHLLQAWPALVSAAKTLREQGVEIGQGC